MSNILIGVTGGIACYKIPSLCRRLLDKGHSVKVIMTEAATKFITPLTFESLTHERVYIDDFREGEEPDNIYHIDLVKWADVFIIAPATANTIAKISYGIADNLLTSSVLAKPDDVPLIVVPSMNTVMYESRQNQNNLAGLYELGYEIVDPVIGNLACKDVGIGKMPEPEDLADLVDSRLKSREEYKNINFLITAGGTKEYIDPVRFISNKSSGKMGLAFCDSVKKRGGSFRLICPSSVEAHYPAVFADTADDMLARVNDFISECDILIMAAAVADYKPKKYFSSKIKKSNGHMCVELEKNPDILQEISGYKRKDQVFVGFAAESDNLQENALKKLKDKKLDMIVANNISRKDIGFDSLYNEVTVFFADGRVEHIGKKRKSEIAEDILNFAVNIFKNKKGFK
ncbi:bifunctional phosphopantothenoylcysteine decarboxylase/phosphopantothenate--cysteine ligase CoaBC [Flexistipes sp.]|uniref:bifunctional phosphopantothenoylcysteine decarboxylase/phosphopantothenate--cysteine ligase CoaBC n=1 Tax=Flexistipes sp. TaxID=3088135 RepID=UPI002E1E178E|nr:bifunctional phosphopantothenoylcysteine decarboxylase/phosphopantothenate--cysteine ligase CoaBC [Flexistipes sp.]